MERGLVAGLVAFRWAAWLWMATVLLVGRDDLDRPWVAVLLVGLALALTAGATVLLRRDPSLLLTDGAVAAELAVGVALLVGHGLAYDQPFGVQSLGSAWPLAGVLSAGLLRGPLVGALAGVLIGMARLAGVLLAGDVDWDGGRVMSIASTTVLYGLAGWAAGFAADRARDAEREITAARAREEVARHLHDGVLQTLAVVQRRTDDPALARLAHQQERDLRDFLALGSRPAASDGLEAGLRRAAARFEDAYGARVAVVVAEDLPRLSTEACDALLGAVGEALANAGKHGRARKVTVYAEPADDGGVSLSVHDDGVGFDPRSVVEGVGLPRSIRARVDEVGGRVLVESSPGRGTEVRMWVNA